MFGGNLDLWNFPLKFTLMAGSWNLTFMVISSPRLGWLPLFDTEIQLGFKMRATSFTNLSLFNDNNSNNNSNNISSNICRNINSNISNNNISNISSNNSNINYNNNNFNNAAATTTTTTPSTVTAAPLIPAF